MTDAERLAVYTAESAAFDGTDLERTMPVHAALELARLVTAHPWWPAGPVQLRAARADAASSSCTWRAEATVVSIAGPQATPATVAHELAHAVAGPSAGHGPAYRRALLDVIQVVTNLAAPAAPGRPALATQRRGRLHVDQLQAALAAAGLAVGERAWAAPTAGGAIAL